jgi:hypothetical protein
LREFEFAGETKSEKGEMKRRKYQGEKKSNKNLAGRGETL